MSWSRKAPKYRKYRLQLKFWLLVTVAVAVAVFDDRMESIA